MVKLIEVKRSITIDIKDLNHCDTLIVRLRIPKAIEGSLEASRGYPPGPFFVLEHLKHLPQIIISPFLFAIHELHKVPKIKHTILVRVKLIDHLLDILLGYALPNGAEVPPQLKSRNLSILIHVKVAEYIPQLLLPGPPPGPKWAAGKLTRGSRGGG
uniref:Uncharacterized protein n=1 Tax=Opuntia streptacantha TaxID=393608 RepID=A0A7C9D7A2_OPUST